MRAGETSDKILLILYTHTSYLDGTYQKKKYSFFILHNIGLLAAAQTLFSFHYFMV